MKIQNIEQYRAEKLRLENQIVVSKAQLSQSFENLKAEINPVRQIAGASQQLFAQSNKNNALVSFGLNIGVDAILRNLVLRKASWITRLVVPFFAKNLLSNYVANHKGNLVEESVSWIKEKVAPAHKAIEIPSKPRRGLLEKALMWVKDVTSEKPEPVLRTISIDNVPIKKNNHHVRKTV